VYLNSILINKFVSGSAQPKLNQEALYRIPIPLPPSQMLDAILSEFEKEKLIIEANRDLIARFERKIQAVMDRVWGNGAAE